MSTQPLRPSPRHERPVLGPILAAAGAPLDQADTDALARAVFIENVDARAGRTVDAVTVARGLTALAAADAAAHPEDFTASAQEIARLRQEIRDLGEEFAARAGEEATRASALAGAAEAIAKRDRLRAAAFEGVMEARRVAGRQDQPISTFDVNIGYNVADLYC